MKAEVLRCTETTLTVYVDEFSDDANIHNYPDELITRYIKACEEWVSAHTELAEYIETNNINIDTTD